MERAGSHWIYWAENIYPQACLRPPRVHFHPSPFASSYAWWNIARFPCLVDAPSGWDFQLEHYLLSRVPKRTFNLLKLVKVYPRGFIEYAKWKIAPVGYQSWATTLSLFIPIYLVPLACIWVPMTMFSSHIRTAWRMWLYSATKHFSIIRFNCLF